MSGPSPKNKTALPPASRRRRVVVAVAVAAAALWFWSQPLVLVTHQENGEWLASSYRLTEDNPDNPRLVLLRQREKLDDLIKSGETQFDKFVLLRKWVHDQWTFKGEAFIYPAWDAAEILDLARKYGNKGFCAQYAIVYLQACQALGLHARYVELPGHFVVGVWSDDYNRWIVMDPMNDCHYERNGDPMTGRQICDAYWQNDLAGVTRVDSAGVRTPVKKEDLAPYRLYSVVADANQLDKPVEVEVNGVRRRLVRETDPRRYPVVGRDRLGFSSPDIAWKSAGAKEEFKNMVQSDDRDDFSYRMNQNFIFVARRDGRRGVAKLILWPENAPTFQEFLVNVDHSEWRVTPTRELFWPLHPGENEISVKARTKFGWMTRPSECRIFFKPAWWGLRAPPHAEMPSLSPS